MIRTTLGVAAAMIFAAASVTQAAAPRPNVVFILVDDLRFDALECTGHPFLKTRNGWTTRW